MATGQDIGEIGLFVAGGISRQKMACGVCCRRLLNVGMREEASLHVGAAKHERSSDRVGYRNGSKPRTFKTRAGELELSVPQVRGCEPYHPGLFNKWQRSERALLVACGEMYFQGVSTRNVKAVLE